MSTTPATRDTRAATPGERLARFCALQRQAFQMLAASPEGYRQFWARNLRKRRTHATPPSR